MGDVVAVRRTLASRGHPKYDRAAWWMTNGDGAAAHDLAPWLSAEDHAALQRRIKVLEEALRKAEEHLHGYEGRDGVSNTFACSYAAQVIAAVLTPR